MAVVDRGDVLDVHETDVFDAGRAAHVAPRFRDRVVDDLTAQALGGEPGPDCCGAPLLTVHGFFGLRLAACSAAASASRRCSNVAMILDPSPGVFAAVACS